MNDIKKERASHNVKCGKSVHKNVPRNVEKMLINIYFLDNKMQAKKHKGQNCKLR